MTPQENYQKHGFLILRNFVPSFFAMYLREYLDTLKKNKKLEGDELPISDLQYVYGDPAFDTFMLLSTDMISGAIGVELIPSHTYGKIYYNNASFLPRSDQEDNQHHSVSLFLGGEFEKLWPMWAMKKEAHKTPQMCDLNIGDVVVYHGASISYWRDHFEGVSHYELSMHYVEKNDKSKDKIYDTRPYIGLPSDTKVDYGVESASENK